MVKLYGTLLEKIMRRLIFAILLLLPITFACSQRDENEHIFKTEKLLAPNSDYIILLEQYSEPAQASETPPNPDVRDFILIQGRDIKHFPAVDSPAISRKGHVVAKNEKGEIIVDIPGEPEPYILNPPFADLSEIFSGGYGISASGENVYRLAVNQVTDKGKRKYQGKLIEFDLDHKRDMGVTTIFELNEGQYKKAEEFIHRCLSLPLQVSENGDAVFYCARKFEDYQPPHDPGDTLNYGSIADSFVKYDFYIYDRESEDFKPWYGSCEAKEYLVDMVGVSTDGNRTLFLSQRPSGTMDLLVQSEPAAKPDVIVTEKTYELFHPCLSPEASRVAYLRRILMDHDGITEAVMMRMDSRTEDVLLRLKGVADVMWADDLKAVAYISRSSYSSLVKDGKEPVLSEGNNYFLHIVNFDDMVDTAVFRAAEADKLRIVNILATAEKFADSSDNKHLGNEPQIVEKKESPAHQTRRKTSRDTSSGPSISSN